MIDLYLFFKANSQSIKNLITEIKSAGPEKYISQPTPEPENKLKQSNDFELDF